MKTRVLIAVPVDKHLLAGDEYAKETKRPADSLSFARGYFEGGDRRATEWAVACWYVDKSTQDQFDKLLAAFPDAKVDKWDDELHIDPAERLRDLAGLSTPPVVFPVADGKEAEVLNNPLDEKIK